MFGVKSGFNSDGRKPGNIAIWKSQFQHHRYGWGLEGDGPPTGKSSVNDDHKFSEYVDFQQTAGSIEPKKYLVIVTGGLAPAVNLSSLALV